jgi:segregation and condensation protein B
VRDLSTADEREEALGELEALFFAAARALSPAQIGRRLFLKEEQVGELVAAYRLRLAEPARGLQLRDTGAGWRLETKTQHSEVVAQERAARKEKPLTAQALEVLAVIALAQPVTTEDVSRTRGTESYAPIETLRRHGLVAPAESSGPSSGKATLWRTTQKFLDRAGLKSLDELARKGAEQMLFADRGVARTLATGIAPQSGDDEP